MWTWELFEQQLRWTYLQIEQYTQLFKQNYSNWEYSSTTSIPTSIQNFNFRTGYVAINTQICNKLKSLTGLSSIQIGDQVYCVEQNFMSKKSKTSFIHTPGPNKRYYYIYHGNEFNIHKNIKIKLSLDADPLRNGDVLDFTYSNRSSILNYSYTITQIYQTLLLADITNKYYHQLDKHLPILYNTTNTNYEEIIAPIRTRINISKNGLNQNCKYLEVRSLRAEHLPQYKITLR